MAQTDFKIRPLEPSDWEGMADIMSQPNVIHFTAQRPFTSRANFRERFERDRPDMVRLGAEIDGRLVGLTTVQWANLRRREHIGDVGISVHDDFQGRGLGTALFGTLIDHVDKWLPLKRLELSVDADNARAITLYERFGFVREGLQRASILRDGIYVDTIMMARLRGL